MAYIGPTNIGPIDLRLLKAQKEKLNALVAATPITGTLRIRIAPEDCEAFKGILHLLDHIQDAAEAGG